MLKSEQLLTKSITISFIDKDEKPFDIDIPFQYICVLELEDITTTIGHTPTGEFLEFLNCNVLNLRIYKEKVDKQVIDTLKNFSILCIKLNFNNETCKAYNVKWYSKDKIHNQLQDVYDEDTIIRVLIANQNNSH